MSVSYGLPSSSFNSLFFCNFLWPSGKLDDHRSYWEMPDYERQRWQQHTWTLQQLNPCHTFSTDTRDWWEVTSHICPRFTSCHRQEDGSCPKQGAAPFTNGQNCRTSGGWLIQGTLLLTTRVQNASKASVRQGSRFLTKLGTCSALSGGAGGESERAATPTPLSGVYCSMYTWAVPPTPGGWVWVLRMRQTSSTPGTNSFSNKNSHGQISQWRPHYQGTVQRDQWGVFFLKEKSV